MKYHTSEERLKQTVDEGKLEHKRFNLPERNLRENLHALSETFSELKNDHPELVSIMVRGSYSKGYAGKNSDIDLSAIVYLDTTKEESEKKDGNKISAADQFDFKQSYIRFLKEKLEAVSGMPEVSVWVYLVNNEIIDESLAEEKYALIQSLFQLSLGSEINKYRKYVIDKLQSEGVEGQRKWEKIIQDLHYLENLGINDINSNTYEKRKQLYPAMLSEAKKYWNLE